MLSKIITIIKEKIPFAFVRFGDGEFTILKNIKCKRNGFDYNPDNARDLEFRRKLYDALTYDREDNYTVGICNKYVEPAHTWLKQRVHRVPIDADIFINRNYLKFIKECFPLFEDAVLIINEKGNVKKLPFKCNSSLTIKNSAWRYNNWIDVSLLYWLSDKKIPQIILVAGGAYSCVLIHELWKKNKNHIYIDVGSALDIFIFQSITRMYQKRLKGTIWENHLNLKIF